MSTILFYLAVVVICAVLLRLLVVRLARPDKRTRIECPNCSAYIDITKDVYTVVCPDCGAKVEIVPKDDKE